MCEAHIQDAPDDIPQSESDVVTPEEERSKRENPLWKIIVRIRREKCVYERKRKRKKNVKSSFFCFYQIYSFYEYKASQGRRRERQEKVANYYQMRYYGGHKDFLSEKIHR